MSQPVLFVDQVSKSFDRVQAVTNVSLTIQPGEIYGLLGPNGAGKTTTISMICGLLPADTGTVSIDGALFSSDRKVAQRKMGVVPQEIALYEELSATDNLMFFGRLSGMSRTTAKQRAEKLLVELSLADRGGDQVRTFSGGMKRRINIGCALMHEPLLLLLDEPTVGIDPQARANILEFVRELASRGTGVLYTTHYLDEAETLCDRIGVIDGGRLLAEGTLPELQNRLGGDRLFVLDGDFEGAEPAERDCFLSRFRIIHQGEKQLVVAAIDGRPPTECLKDLLNLPVTIENAMIKKPNLNDVFLQLTGRELRE